MSVSLSLEEAKKLFFQQHPSGISLPSEIDEITYLPENSVYRFANTKRFFEWLRYCRGLINLFEWIGLFVDGCI